MAEIRTSPCIACPYRKDAPSGVWSEQEYEKLRAFDNVTAEQPPAVFRCHATPELNCHGWAVVHSNRGHDRELLGLRLWPPDNDQFSLSSPIPLFSSGGEAADHGMRDIEHPSEEAKARVRSLLAKHGERLL